MRNTFRSFAINCWTSVGSQDDRDLKGKTETWRYYQRYRKQPIRYISWYAQGIQLLYQFFVFISVAPAFKTDVCLNWIIS